MGIDDVFENKGTRKDARRRRRNRKIRRRRITAIIVVLALVAGVSGIVAVSTATGAFSSFFESKKDYEGEGEGEVTVTVIPGASASQVANQLVEEDVIQAASPFLKEIESRGVVIKAGTFKMRKRMSSKAAVDVLEEATAAHRLTVAEGHTIKTIKANAIKAGVNEQQLDKAIDKKKPKDYGLDVDAPNLEGYLYPATYDIDPSRPVEALVQDMVNKTKDELNKLAIPHDDAHYYLTLASLVQIEANSDPEVQAKVARVFVNRVGKKSQTGGLLQSDATVAYIHGARDDLTTTKEERESNNPYNTYKHKGWTPGPINSPGEPAVRAALNPAKGDWQFFVATNPDEGTVKFASNYKDHQKNVEEFRKWLREHRKKNG
ncbi:YceG family protein [Brevibacterium mcbrellneri ATCC 49030]|uniref:Endolytic murein transglycosylase n=1 Tax=Brevibacterium mcbrellneri ATCC 49030 TaxID=585530 RepID=D4YPE5_9MICO|nr:YceG family protein [Brevibacterium mcbrellneri ATCC 49030]